VDCGLGQTTYTKALQSVWHKYYTRLGGSDLRVLLDLDIDAGAISGTRRYGQTPSHVRHRRGGDW
jgi:PHP family Zn ribbon phosphoesterase